MSPVGSRLEAASMAEHIAIDILSKALDVEGLRATMIESMASEIPSACLEGEPEDLVEFVRKNGKKIVDRAAREYVANIPRLALMVAGVVRAKHYHAKAVDDFFGGRDR